MAQSVSAACTWLQALLKELHELKAAHSAETAKWAEAAAAAGAAAAAELGEAQREQQAIRAWPCGRRPCGEGHAMKTVRR